jgi:hypothetical protein
VELYGLIAVLMVLIPEWMASGTLKGFRDHRRGADLPVPSGAWERIPELRLAAMTLADLRLQARAMRVWGYAGLDRDALQARMLRRLRRRLRLRPVRRLEAGGRPRTL